MRYGLLVTNTAAPREAALHLGSWAHACHTNRIRDFHWNLLQLKHLIMWTFVGIGYDGDLWARCPGQGYKRDILAR